jgi:hypothetical protein
MVMIYSTVYHSYYRLNSTHCILYIYKDNEYSPSIGVQDDIGITDILSKVMQAAIAGVSIYIVRSSTIIWRNATTTKTSLSTAEILEYQEQKTQKRRNHQTDKELDFSGHE